jgi:DNA-dependent RNA polymerase auxiliary subunit epsilon
MEENTNALLINIDKKVDQIKNKLSDVEVVQTRMETDLKYHIRRTDLLEEQIDHINKNVEAFDIIKIVFLNAIKIVSFIAGITIAIITIIRFFKN